MRRQGKLCINCTETLLQWGALTNMTFQNTSRRTSAKFLSKSATAKVSPLHKDGSLFDRSSYRPISVLAVVSKILERHVHQTFYYFLSQHDLLLDSQFGFRSSRSCELAIADLSDNILTNMDNKLLNGLLLVDLKKAFDLVDHDTLLNKLRIYGCSHSTMVWFRSYLSGRSQKTQFRGTLSEALPVSVGVLQGSILGPFSLLFISTTCR